MVKKDRSVNKRKRGTLAGSKGEDRDGGVRGLTLHEFTNSIL
jgi:hypothetical protein